MENVIKEMKLDKDEILGKISCIPVHVWIKNEKDLIKFCQHILFRLDQKTSMYRCLMKECRDILSSKLMERLENSTQEIYDFYEILRNSANDTIEKDREFIHEALMKKKEKES